MDLRATLLLLTALALAAPAGAVEFVVSFQDNEEGDFAARGWLDPASLFQRNVRAAAGGWAVWIDAPDVVLYVDVRADRRVLRAGGVFATGGFVGVNAAGQDIFEPRPLGRVLGRNTPGSEADPDILVSVDPIFFDLYYWLDPTPEARSTAIPLGRTDFVSIVLHELGHGLGIAGYRTFAEGPDYGRLTLGYVQLFDEMSYFGGDGQPLDDLGIPNPMFYEGRSSSALVEGDLPLTNVGPRDRISSQNFYHIGSCASPVELVTTLMNGCVAPTDGTRMAITPYDLAMIADLGYPIRGGDVESLRRAPRPARAWAGRPHHAGPRPTPLPPR